MGAFRILTPGGQAIGGVTPGSLRFYGDTNGDDGRVKTSVQGQSTPANIGNTDITVEFFCIVEAGNTQGAITPGANVNWTTGNIIFDRDVFGSSVAGFGIAFGDGMACFGLNVAGGSARTIVGTTDLRDGEWHHIAVQRRSSDGFVSLHVDGALESSSSGPTGSLQYPDSHEPEVLCGPSGNLLCDFSDPFMVLGSEKHDANAASFFGFLGELRGSAALRYSMSGGLTVPTGIFNTDANTAFLYHMDDQAGMQLSDHSGNAQHGTLSLDGSNRPTWETESPFA